MGMPAKTGIPQRLCICPAPVGRVGATSSWRGRTRIRCLVRTLARNVTDVVGDEQSRANQPDARSCHERRDGAGSDALPIGVSETRGRA